MNVPTDLKQMNIRSCLCTKNTAPSSIPGDENNLCQDVNPMQAEQVRDALVTQAAKTKVVTKDERKNPKQIEKNPSPYEVSILKLMKSIMKVLRS